MNRFKCPACGGNQYTAADEAEECIYCGHRELVKMEELGPEESREKESWPLTGRPGVAAVPGGEVIGYRRLLRIDQSNMPRHQH